MKRITAIVLMVLAIIVCADRAEARAPKDDRRASREQLADRQSRLIAEKLGLSSETAARFIDTYKRCQKEIWELGSQRGGKRRGAMTEEQTDSLLKARFDHRQKLLDIRRKYYEEYSTFLTPKQIERVYKMERRMMERLNKRRESRRR